jgi:exopolyphosphatase / guanosine-5'-triphosphate,3'-diphosphate pyrophosphatase
MRFAAIDVGSNAVRLLFCNVFNKPDGETVFKKASLIRVPIRLGEDAFSNQYITKDKEDKLVNTMIAFKHLISVHDVISYRACATSAMREALNSDHIVNRIFNESGIKLEIIDGKKEAEIIYSNHIAEQMSIKRPYLYIDVGGGSTELTLFDEGKIIDSISFNIGTIRILQNKISKGSWNELKDWIYKVTNKYANIGGIGSGGNINKLVNLAKKKDERQISHAKLKEIFAQLNIYSLEERITILGLNPDRADVIIPATEIFLFVMKHANIDKIMVPQIGLSDGIIHLLYEEFLRNSESTSRLAGFE